MTNTFHVISPVSWIGDVFRQTPFVFDPLSSCFAPLQEATISRSHNPPLFPTGSEPYHVQWHSGLEPVEAIDDTDIIWISPALLIALNDWRARHLLLPLQFCAPTNSWLSSLPAAMTGRSVITTSVEEILRWRDFPSQLGVEPWSRICNGRVDSFNAARRDLASLQRALLGNIDTKKSYIEQETHRDNDSEDNAGMPAAPLDSLIELSAHVPGIAEEWNIIVDDSRIVATSGYCVHTPPDSHRIVTVFDGATFEPSHCDAAQHVVSDAIELTNCTSASIVVAFSEYEAAPIILETNPVWCSTPYPYEPSQMQAYIRAIARSRILPSGSKDSNEGNTTFNSFSHQIFTDRNPTHDVEMDQLYVPDSWMIRQYGQRYSRFN